MRNKTLLYINRIIAFCSFLCAFGKLCFEFGFNANHEGFEFLFIFPLFYLGILIASHKLFEEVCYTRKPYIILASIIIAFILIMGLYFYYHILTKIRKSFLPALTFGMILL